MTDIYISPTASNSLSTGRSKMQEGGAKVSAYYACFSLRNLYLIQKRKIGSSIPPVDFDLFYRWNKLFLDSKCF
jgi:hypothetical protein